MLGPVQIGTAIDREILQRAWAGLIDPVAGQAVKSGERRQFGFADDHGIAALLVRLGVIGDQADAEIRTGLNIKLAAQHITITVVAFDPGRRLEIAVALAPGSRHTNAGNIIDQRNADPGLYVHEVVVAVGRVGEAFDLGQRRPLGGYAERTGRGIASEQRALRPAQDFQPLQIDQIAQRHAGA